MAHRIKIFEKRGKTTDGKNSGNHNSQSHGVIPENWKPSKNKNFLEEENLTEKFVKTKEHLTIFNVNKVFSEKLLQTRTLNGK